MSHFKASRGGPAVLAFVAQAQSLVRLAAIAAVFAVALQPSATNAAELRTATDQAGVTSWLALGEDRFDEDDEFNCNNINEGEDRCVDNPPDRFDEGDDEFDGKDRDESGCENYDDGKDRCLDNGEDRFDEGDDEYAAQAQPTDAGPTATISAAPTSSVASADLTAPAALAAVLGLGVGGLWLLRRTKS